MHVLNLLPCTLLQLDVPNKVWIWKDVTYDHLCVFGCKTFVHIPKDERFKLDVKTKQCVFVGYGQNEFGYKFYDPIEKKIVRSRDIAFVKNRTIEDIDKVGKLMSEHSDESFDMNITLPTPVSK